MIAEQKGKRLLNKLVYLQSLSNIVLDFKIKAKNCKVQSICGRKKSVFEGEKKNLLLVRLEKARDDAVVQRPPVYTITCPHNSQP